MLILDGPAGIGKTSLLGAIAHRAQRRQVVCLWATGAERERDLEWSVVRSLFAGSVEAIVCPARAELERGAARMALPLVGGLASAGAPADRGALLYALYWLLVGLAGGAPLLLCVDDAHWADEASLGWLEYLGARIPEVRIVLAVSHRSDADSHPAAGAGGTPALAGSGADATQRPGVRAHTRRPNGACARPGVRGRLLRNDCRESLSPRYARELAARAGRGARSRSGPAVGRGPTG